jgi:CubicO group peptidase (beta-lactamase class C family)
MPRRFPALVSTFSLVAACSSAATPPPRYVAPPQRFADAQPVPRFTDPARRARLEAAFPAIDAKIEEHMKATNVPGLAVAIVIDGQTAYAKGFGVADLATGAPARADTVYRIGSITKSFTGLAILALRDQGLLAVDDPLVRWIPEAAGLVYPTRDAHPLTLRQMLNHSSGLPRMGDFARADVTEQGVVDALAGMPLDRAPGVASVYSNLGFSLLGIVVGRAARSSYHDVVAQRIWKPLGMTSTFWESEDVPPERLSPAYERGPKGLAPVKQRERLGAADAAGGIYSTVEDMARYVAFQLDAYPPRDDADSPTIARATRREAHSTGVHGGSHVQLAPAAPPGEPVVHVSTGTYGFGWGREENCYFDELVGHGGAIDSYGSDVSFLPAYGVGVVVMSNFPGANTGGISRLVLEQLRQTGALRPRVAPLDPAFEPVAKQFMALVNHYDERALKAMLAPERPPLPVEKDEILGYHALHGTCTAFHTVEAMSKAQATIGFTCERGTFEVMFQLDGASRRVNGFVGTSRDVAPPPALAASAKAITGLVGAWDESVYQQVLSKAVPPHDVMKEGFTAIGAQHGACKLKSTIHVGFDWGFDLECERGGGMRLTVVTDPADASTVKGLGFQPAEHEGLCPRR